MVQAIERPRPASLRERKRTLSCLNIEKVSCHYNGRPVLEQLSQQVADNEIVCLLGPAAVARPRCSRRWPVCCPGPGEIRLGETLLDAPGVSVPPEARHIGMIFQDYALFPHLTVAENVGFGLTGQDRGSRQQQVEGRWRWSTCRGWGSAIPISSPAASSSGWPSPAPWCASRA